MKGYFCPNCGKRQQAKLDAPSKVSIPCTECGKTLLIKMDKGKWTIMIESSNENSTNAQRAR